MFSLRLRASIRRPNGMAHIRLDDKEFELSVGELRIGTGDDAGVRLDTSSAKRNFAIITVDSRGTATVRRAAAETSVLVNGVALGAEPAPLLHGDRIEVAGRQLRFSDDRKAGSTVLTPALSAPIAASAASDRGRAGVAGGRLISLVDGREYPVPAGGLRIGRDAGCDVVVPGDDVSRHHAELSVGPAGYVLRDLSANGVFVNAGRAGDAHPLRRGDVIRIGTEEFRFYADHATLHARRPSPVRALSVPHESEPVLATLEVTNAGPTRGTQFKIRSPLTHVGRGPHNDVVIGSESVSDAHAKIQRRESGWVVVDMESTNGTYVGGRRVRGEHPLSEGTALRLGGVKLIFRSVPIGAGDDGGTRVIVGFKPLDQKRAPAVRPIVPSRQADASTPAAASRRVPALVWVAAAVVIGATLLFVIQDR